MGYWGEMRGWIGTALIPQSEVKQLDMNARHEQHIPGMSANTRIGCE